MTIATAEALGAATVSTTLAHTVTTATINAARSLLMASS
jgi:hypothetical protein